MRALAPFLAAMALAAGFTATPKPAEAQAVVRICAVNQSATVIRSRFTYTDWQGAQHTSRWVTNAVGERNCVTLQDLGSLTIEVETNDVYRWISTCQRQVPDPRRNATLFVTGTMFSRNCTLEH